LRFDGVHCLKIELPTYPLAKAAENADMMPSNCNYKDLTGYEKYFLDLYLNDYDKCHIDEFLRSGEKITQGMRDFIADVLTKNKKVSRPNGKRSSTKARDFEIYWRVAYLLYHGSSKTKAYDTVADLFNDNGYDDISTDVILKAYKRIDKEFGSDQSYQLKKSYVFDMIKKDKDKKGSVLCSRRTKRKPSIIS
jgi:hypothetical protein